MVVLRELRFLPELCDVFERRLDICQFAQHVIEHVLDLATGEARIIGGLKGWTEIDFLQNGFIHSLFKIVFISMSSVQYHASVGILLTSSLHNYS